MAPSVYVVGPRNRMAHAQGFASIASRLEMQRPRDELIETSLLHEVGNCAR